MVHANYTEACEKGSGARPGPWSQAPCRRECHPLKLMTLRLRRGIFIEPKTALPSTGCGTSRWLTTQGWGSRDALVGRLTSRPRSPGQPWGTVPAPARNAPRPPRVSAARP